MFKVGDVVRVREDAMNSHWKNEDWIATHGWLYIVVKHSKVDKDAPIEGYYCRSVATGHCSNVDSDVPDDDLFWFPEELEKADV